MIGEIGGFNDGLSKLIGFFLSIYYGAIFDSEIIKSLFLFRKTPDPHKFTEIKKITKHDVIKM